MLQLDVTVDQVQRRATKVLQELKKINIERLKMCNLPTVHFRQKRGDMIDEVLKILTDKYDTAAAAPVMDIYDLKTNRGNDFKLNKIRAKYYANTSLLTGLLTCGTVDLIMLLRQIVLIVLNHV